MIKINTNKLIYKFFLIFSFFAFQTFSDDFKAVAKFKPEYPKSAYAKRISGYAIVTFNINAKGRTKNQNISSAKCFNLVDKSGKYYWYDFTSNTIKEAYDCKYFDFKALKASKQLLYINNVGRPIKHSYKYNFTHWSLIRVDSVIDLKSGDFILQ
tara:strand:+ start:1122 stop:1586 length:465 start_codon:yes stop_codon:yes gene_type:complete